MSEVGYERRGDIAILTLNRPTANALAPSLRAALKTRLQEALGDDDVAAIVLRGAGGSFCSGVDITEYDGRLATPWVSDICRAIESAAKPIVAALRGAALGAGFELALAAHARVARKGTRGALPEVALGLIPCGGTTQRAPRLVGAQTALDIMLSGRVVDITEGRMRGFVDTLTEDDPLDAAAGMAASMAETGHWHRPADRVQGLSDPEAYREAVAAAFERLNDRDGAERDIVRCVEAAQIFPYERGLDFESALFKDRLTSSASRGLRHIFAAERRAADMPEMSAPDAPLLRRVVLVGSTTILPEFAVALLDGARKVQIALPDDTARDTVMARIRHIYDSAVSRGRLPSEQRDERLARLGIRTDYKALEGADVVFDCGGTVMGGDMPALKEGAFWATLDGDGTATPGCRVYRPAHRSRLVEICAGETIAQVKVAALARMFSGLGRTVVRCAAGTGSAGHAMADALYRGALVLAEAGMSPYAVDQAARDLGFAQGPFRLIDAEGLDRVRARLVSPGSGTAEGLPLLDRLLAEGSTGQAGGYGFYQYGADGARPRPDLPRPETRLSAALGDIGAACALQAALANAAARLLEAGAVQRASDLDVVMVKGYGFARERGGPLLRADQAGMLRLLTDMKALADLSDALWRPAPLIEEMFKNGEGFFGRPAQSGQ